MKKQMAGVALGVFTAMTVFAESAAEVGTVRLKGYLGERRGSFSGAGKVDFTVQIIKKGQGL